MKRIRHIRQCRAGTRASNRRVPRARLSYGAAGLQGTAAGCSECAEDREAAHIRRPDRAAARTAERTGRQEAAGRTRQVVEGTIPLTAQRSFRLAGGRRPAAAQERKRYGRRRWSCSAACACKRFGSMIGGAVCSRPPAVVWIRTFCFGHEGSSFRGFDHFSTGRNRSAVLSLAHRSALAGVDMRAIEADLSVAGAFAFAV